MIKALLSKGLLAVLAASVVTVATTSGQMSKQDLPTVATAAVPFYPRPARTAHIQGAVRLRISTDGERVSGVVAEAGPPMLIPAAEENVKTWLFEKHDPVTFDVTFRYKMLPGSQCAIDNGVVVLHLPTEVEVSAKGIETCDPVSSHLK